MGFSIGFNHNPTVKPFTACYRCLLVHDDILANKEDCVAQDQSVLLSTFIFFAVNRHLCLVRESCSRLMATLNVVTTPNEEKQRGIRSSKSLMTKVLQTLLTTAMKMLLGTIPGQTPETG